MEKKLHRRYRIGHENGARLRSAKAAWKDGLSCSGFRWRVALNYFSGWKRGITFEVGQEIPESHSGWLEKVLFTDESKWEIYGIDRKVYIRTRTGERMIPQRFKPTVKHGVGHLHRSGSTLTKEKHRSCLQRHDPPSGLIFVEKIHTAAG